ncbi:MAG: UDP-N-acetylmuramoyl-L-alanine--D-glutamate ligase, partial [Anaerolineales bacterium]
RRRSGAVVVVNDRRSAQELQAARDALAGLPVEWVLGGHPLSLLDGADLVCPSGGIPLELPLVAEARRRGIPLSNDSQIFLEAAPCPVIGITGSAGKTTTTTLLERMAEQVASRQVANRQVASRQVAIHNPKSEIRNPFTGGNIGNPLISMVEGMTPNDLAVMELSSFQLDVMTRSPYVGAILNITPNHLDRHGTMEAYTNAKAKILDFQGADDVAVLGRDDPGAWGLAGRVRGKLVTFGWESASTGRGTFPQMDVFLRGNEIILRDGHSESAIMPRSDVLLRGDHNLLNVLAACAIAAAAGIPAEAMRAGVRGFRGVPQRLEFVRTWGGADWYDDSIATAPERAMAGIRSFDNPLVLLAGGQDKDLPWEGFVDLVCERVDHLVAFGETAEMITGMVRESRRERPYTIDCCARLQPAVQAAARAAAPGDVVLLSPGGTSFDEFRDFEDRGEWFKKWVMAL